MTTDAIAEPPPALPPTPVLHTARLTLRPLRLKDTPTIQRRFPRWEIVRDLAAVVPWPYPEDGAATYMAMTLEAMAAGERCVWAIRLDEGTDDLIGIIELRADGEVTRDHRGFWIDPEFQGRGLMTEAAERVTEFAFLDLGWPRLWLTNAEGNAGSRRIKEKQGAVLVDRVPGAFVSGPAVKEVWLLTRERRAARRLAELGGTMPDLEIPPRRRSDTA
jgi:RimJ/RimL family protein N-acetyltransferase